MPVHYIERGDLEDEVRRLEAEGEVVVSVVAEGDNFQVFTRASEKAVVRKPLGEVETR